MTDLVQPTDLEAPGPRNYTLALEQLIAIAGAFPPRDGPGAASIYMAMIHTMACNFPAFGAAPCTGKLMSIPQDTALFSLLGTVYGGNGETTFGLPDLRGQVAVGGGFVGEVEGQTLAVTMMIAANAAPGYPMVGTIGLFAGNFAPSGWLRADGSTLPISENVELFEAIGTTYGGDGEITFNLPNLVGGTLPGQTGSAPVGVGQGMLGPPVALGQQIPADANNGIAGLGLNYLVSLQGIFPPNEGNGGFPASEQVLGEIVAFAGAAIPAGWAPADGRLLSVAENQALFAMVGTTYGGDGQTTFGLPDLRGRMVMGSTS